MSKPKVSICIPIHDMQGGAEFLWASVNALMEQSFQDFEIVITKAGKMATNTNWSIKRARGEIVKILYLDDRLAHKDALQNIVDAFENPATQWVITGCDTNPNPRWTDDIETGNNKLGSPSVLAFRNQGILLFDENMSWLLDCDYYKRMYRDYGLPSIIEGVEVLIGQGSHQMTHILTNEEKLQEFHYMKEKYE